MHADVARLDLGEPGERAVPGVVALDEELGDAVREPEEGFVVLAVGDRGVLRGDVLPAGVLHLPEDRPGMGHPLVQQVCVPLHVERDDAQRPGTHAAPSITRR